jgi:hypothetical protein
LTHVGIGHRADAAMLAHQIYNAPPTVALLDVIERESRHFGAPQTTAEQDGENGAVAQPLLCCRIRGVQQGLSLPESSASFPSGCRLI